MRDLHAEYRVGDYSTKPVADWFEVNGFETMRLCPHCRRRMRTNGNGNFWCLECEYWDTQDVRKLLHMGLDYPVPVNSKTMARSVGLWK